MHSGKPLRFALLFALLAAPAGAQLATPGQPASARHPKAFSAAPPAFVLPPPDVRRLMEEDDARQQWPFRYGAVIPTALSSDEAGEWSESPGGELVWRLALSSPGARGSARFFCARNRPPENRKPLAFARGSLWNCLLKTIRFNFALTREKRFGTFSDSKL